MSSTSKPNFTAWFVMQGVLATLHHPDYRDASNNELVRLYEPLAKIASKTRLISRLIDSLPYSFQYRIGQWVTNPSRLRHFLFRKKEIEKQSRELLAEGGVTQVVVLGAGLDLLALRLAGEYPGVNFIEIDTFESQSFKVASLQKIPTQLPANLEFIEGDLQNPLEGILKPSRLHDPKAKTLWIAEGFFMFVSQEAVQALLEGIQRISVAGSHLIMTTLVQARPSGLIKHSMCDFFMRREQSPYRWFMGPADVGGFVGGFGFGISRQMPYRALHSQYSTHTVMPEPLEEMIHLLKLSK